MLNTLFNVFKKPKEYFCKDGNFLKCYGSKKEPILCYCKFKKILYVDKVVSCFHDDDYFTELARKSGIKGKIKDIQIFDRKEGINCQKECQK